VTESSGRAMPVRESGAHGEGALRKDFAGSSSCSLTSLQHEPRILPPEVRTVLLRWLPVVIWTGVILGFSSETWGAAQTSRWLMPLLRLLLPSADPETLEAVHVGIRKLAHVVEYALLAALLARALSGQFRLARARSGIHILLMVASVAAVDEYRQSFSPGRTGSLRDWGIDLVGAGLAVMLLRWRTGRARRGAGRSERQGVRSRGDSPRSRM